MQFVRDWLAPMVFFLTVLLLTAVLMITCARIARSKLVSTLALTVIVLMVLLVIYAIYAWCMPGQG